VKNRLRRAFTLAAVSALFVVSIPTTAFADEASDSTVASVEAAQEAPEAPAEEKKAEEVPAAPVKEEPPAPVKEASVVSDVPDPVVVPAPIVEPAPAPVVPPVETPAVPELPAAPAKDVAIDDPAPAVVVPPVEAETPPGESVPAEEAAPVVNLSVMVTTVQQINDQGWIYFYAQTQNVAPGTNLGTYTVHFTGAESRLASSVDFIVGEDGVFESTLFWKCATPGATISITGPDGLVPIRNEITGTTATVQTLPILGTPGCGTTEPVQQIIEVQVPELVIVLAGENQPGSVTVKEPVVGVTLDCTPAGAIQGMVNCKWVLEETPTVKYVFADGPKEPFTVELGEYSESVPNPGINPDYANGTLDASGQATLTPVGPFNRADNVGITVSGTSKTDGSQLILPPTFQETMGLAPVVIQVDLSQFCGLVHYSWLTQTVTPSGSSQAVLMGGVVVLPACDPLGGDDGDDNENPNPNPDPSHPGHGHGHGDGDGDHGDHDGCNSWNSHSCEPNNGGPVGAPGDLGNNVGVEADASANNVVVQSSSVEELGMGNAVPEESDLSNAESSYTGDLAETGANDSWLVFAVILLGVGAALVVLASWKRPRPHSRRRTDAPIVK
jgi:hypothetical protein